jgi:hypothetical protein
VSGQASSEESPFTLQGNRTNRAAPGSWTCPVQTPVRRLVLATATRRTAETRFHNGADRCPELDPTHRHLRAFARIIRDLSGDRLADWMDRVCDDNLPAAPLRHRPTPGFSRSRARSAFGTATNGRPARSPAGYDWPDSAAVSYLDNKILGTDVKVQGEA